MEQLDIIFKQLKLLLIKYADNFDARDEFIGSTAKRKKEEYHLYGKKIISIANRKPQPTFVVGIIKQKDFVGFYSMPIYSHLKSFELSQELKKLLKGKSCFHIKKLDKELIFEIESVIVQGIELYKKEGWI